MSTPRSTFRPAERLKSKILLEKAATGKKVYSGPVRCHFILVADQSLPALAQAAFTVPKRIYKRAVDRNRIKRRMREAYRLQKYDFYQKLGESGMQCALLLIYSGNRDSEPENFHEIIKSILDRINRDAKGNS